MRLEALEVVPYALPFRQAYVTSRGELNRRELALLRLSAEGLVGLGEAAPLALRGGPDLSRLELELRELCWPALRELDLTAERIWAALAACRNRGASAQAIAAVDVALHDLLAKAMGEPVWRMLGAAEARPVSCNATLPVANPSSLVRLASEWAADGFETFKLKVGVPGDTQQVALVRSELGPAVRIRVDANAAWTLAEATERLRALGRHTIEVCEQPVAGLEEMATLRARSRVRLAADESVVTPRDARRALELRACELATVKLAKCGGIAAGLEVAAEIPVYLSSALDGPVGIAAAAHAAQALPRSGPAAGMAHGLATARLLDGTIASRQPRLDGATIEVDESPGLGVEIDDGLLAERRL